MGVILALTVAAVVAIGVTAHQREWALPGGGPSQILSVYGLVLVLILVLVPTLTRAWRAGLFTGLALAAIVEGYTRWYLARHWVTDAVGAIVLGYLLLAVAAAAAAALNSKFGPGASSSAGPADPSTAARSTRSPAPRHASVPNSSAPR